MFLTRTISGVSIFCAMLALFAIGGYTLAGVMFVVSVAGYWELSKAFANPNAVPGAERTPLPAKKKFDFMDILGTIGIFFYYFATVFLKNSVYQLIVVILFIVVILLVYVCSFPKVQIDRIAGVIFSFIYCPVFLSFVYMTRSIENYGYWLIWLILISSWGCDTFAYLFGRAFGKKKVFPKLSPNKSLAGCLGGVIATGIVGATFGYCYVNKLTGNNYMFIYIAIICSAGSVMGIVGDLVASGIKRNKGFKDFSKLIPGHGGIMDRFDSTVITAVTVYALSMLFIGLK